jgi:hypothetical protein
MEGLSNEVPFFIYPYPPEDALVVAAAKKRIKNRLSNSGITVFEIDLYDLSVELLKERGVWDRLLAVEPEQDKADFREMLQGMLDPQLHIAPAIRDRLAQADPRAQAFYRRHHFDPDETAQIDDGLREIRMVRDVQQMGGPTEEMPRA